MASVAVSSSSQEIARDVGKVDRCPQVGKVGKIAQSKIPKEVPPNQTSAENKAKYTEEERNLIELCGKAGGNVERAAAAFDAFS